MTREEKDKLLDICNLLGGIASSLEQKQSTEIDFIQPKKIVGKLISIDVLDKIRADIEAKCCITVGRENDAAITLHDVFEIIDKYKAESEDKE